MSGNRRLDALNNGIEELYDEINQSIEVERRDTVTLHHLERTVNEQRQKLIEKRENLARLEKKAVFLLAAKAVEEFPEGSRVQRDARFRELVGLNGAAVEAIQPSQLNRVLGATVEEAYAAVILFL